MTEPNLVEVCRRCQEVHTSIVGDPCYYQQVGTEICPIIEAVKEACKEARGDWSGGIGPQ